MSEPVIVRTALEWKMLFRAHDAFVAGYYDEWTDHGGVGCRPMCHLWERLQAPTPRPRGSVLRALRGIGLP